MAAAVAAYAGIRSRSNSFRESFTIRRASDTFDKRRVPEHDLWKGVHDVELLMLDG